MHIRYPWIAMLAIAVVSSETAAAKDDPGGRLAEKIGALFETQPQSFELTLMSHFSDDDFGFHVQTAVLPPGDYLYPRYRVSEAQAKAILESLAKTPFAARANEGKRSDRFRPEKPKPIQRVFSLTVRCGDRLFFEDVGAGDEIQKRAAAIHAALKGGTIATEFETAFQSRLER